jgi:hypothetical protein
MAVSIKNPTTIASPSVPTTAVIVCHGMGQQVRFETLEDVASAILSQASQVVSKRVGLVQSSDDLLARSELLCADSNGTRHSIHLYEAYWAPLTEGQIGLKETFKFLWDGGKRGLKASLQGEFKRWLFGDMRPLILNRATGVKIGLALLTIVMLFALIFGWSLSIFLVLGCIVHNFWEGHSVSASIRSCTGGFGSVVWMLIWIIAGWILRKARYFLIQYVGDVAIYVSSYTVSRFYDIRHRIQQVGLSVAKTVYAAKYDRVIIVGHSLGSVVAYDTLNAMINEDILKPPGTYNVRDATRALITCGSPLDKTAFIFRTQLAEDNPEVREALAASTQPLIVDYEFRKIPNRGPGIPGDFEWVNVYSRKDLISGSLEYYDWHPAATDSAVRNVKDTEASVSPIKAHTEYWDRSALRRELWKAIVT